MSAPMLAPCDLKRLRIEEGKRRIGDAVGAGWRLDQPRSLREWYGLTRMDDERKSMTLPDLARLMWWLDEPRCGRALAAVLEAVLPADADPRSLAVILLLRAPERWAIEAVRIMTEVEKIMTGTGVTSATWAARMLTRAGECGHKARMGGFAGGLPAAHMAVTWAEDERPDVEIGTILLDAWEN